MKLPRDFDWAKAHQGFRNFWLHDWAANWEPYSVDDF